MASIDDCMDAMVAAVKAVTVTLDENAVYAGWPDPQELEKDLEQYTVHITVYSSSHGEKLEMGYLQPMQELVPPSTGLTGAVSADLIINTGTITLGGTLGLFDGTFTIAEIHKSFVTFKPDPKKTINQNATLLAAAITADADMIALNIDAVAVGPAVTVTVQPASSVFGRAIHLGFPIGATGKNIVGTRQQKAGVEIHVWAYDNASRKLFCNAIDDALAATHFLDLTDGSAARLMYQSSTQTDIEVRHSVYRRILRYTVEYMRTQIVPTFKVLETQSTIDVSVE